MLNIVSNHSGCCEEMDYGSKTTQKAVVVVQMKNDGGLECKRAIEMVNSGHIEDILEMQLIGFAAGLDVEKVGKRKKVKILGFSLSN